MKWQPIETAPKDGTRILVLMECSTGPVVDVAAWGRYGKYKFAWKEHYACGRKMYLTPTHWMQLPPPPKEED